jgi:hypothetical protein
VPLPHDDPGLPDDCIFFAPDASLPAWLSPRLKVTGPAATGDIMPGVSNTIQVFVNRSPESCTIPSPISKVFINLYICIPATALDPIVPTPGDPVRAFLINGPVSGTIDLGTDPAATLTAGGQQSTQILWTPDASKPKGDAQAAGHRCLIAVCYPHTPPPTLNEPDNSNFHVGTDSHYAQHNLCILPCNAPQRAQAPPGEPGQPQRREAARECSLTVAVTNLNKREPQQVGVQIVPEPHPNGPLAELVKARCRGVPGFRRLAPEAPPPPRVTFPDFPDVVAKEVTRQGCVGIVLKALGLAPAAVPHQQAELPMQAGQKTSLIFEPDLSRATPGDAYIHHLTQTGADGRLQGGITVVTVAE